MKRRQKIHFSSCNSIFVFRWKRIFLFSIFRKDMVRIGLHSTTLKTYIEYFSNLSHFAFCIPHWSKSFSIGGLRNFYNFFQNNEMNGLLSTKTVVLLKPLSPSYLILKALSRIINRRTLLIYVLEILKKRKTVWQCEIPRRFWMSATHVSITKRAFVELSQCLHWHGWGMSRVQLCKKEISVLSRCRDIYFFKKGI